MKSFTELKEDHKGLTDAIHIVMALVMIIVVGAIGVFIADRTLTATDTDGNASNGLTLGNATLGSMLVNFLSAGNTGSSFVVILVIAFIGGIAISYLLGMFGRKRR